jgi:hypothetical protein
MPPDEAGPVIVHAIQLAIAPLFLLTGIATRLGVMANRLARIIDRARALDQFRGKLDEKAQRAGQVEFTCLERRRHPASWSTNFCTCTALLVCLVIVTLFVDGILERDLKWLAPAPFVGAMIAPICGLAIFLREVYLATHAGRFEAPRFAR